MKEMEPSGSVKEYSLSYNFMLSGLVCIREMFAQKFFYGKNNSLHTKMTKTI